MFLLRINRLLVIVRNLVEKLLFDDGKITRKEKEYMHYAVNPGIRALMEKHAKYLITVLSITESAILSFQLFCAQKVQKTLKIPTNYLDEADEDQLREAFDLQPKLLKELLAKYLKQKTPANFARLDEIIENIITENRQFVEDFLKQKD